MTLGHDELTRPLGMEAPPGRRSRIKALPWAQIAVGLVSVVVVALTGWLALVRDPLGGEPFAVTTIERIKPPASPVATADAPPKPAAPETASPPDAPKDRMTASEVEQQSGVKVTRPPGSDAPEGIVIRVPQPGEVKLAPAPDKRLVERSRHGIVPKIGADGAKPSDVYARPVTPFPGGKVAGRIAIVVGGLGLSQGITSEAIAKLPGAVTLAFAPYGADLEKQVARARDAGHEILLQVPMEPFDYPDNDPGPHTLTTSGQASETMDRLTWLMSRFPGYVGIMNYMGGKFTANEAALNPVLRELAGRGLLVVDDGSSGRSLVASLAPILNLTAGKADAVIDITPKGTAIDEQLAKLEALARSKGLAIGAASSLPVTIDRLVAWSKGLEAKGIQLVPVSAALTKPGRG